MTCEPWPLAWTCETPPDGEASQLALARTMAEAWLRSLTLNRVGACQTTGHYELPATGRCVTPRMDRMGTWHNDVNSGQACCSLRLTPGPVITIDAVSVNGVLLDELSYRRYGDTIRRIGQCWPGGSHCDEPPIVITHTYGIPLGTDDDPTEPYGSVAAVALGALTEEIVNAMCGRKCALPSRMTSIIRNNVTVNYGAPEEWMKRNRTGLPLVDELLAIVNPNGLRRTPYVYSPDMPTRVS